MQKTEYSGTSDTTVYAMALGHRVTYVCRYQMVLQTLTLKTDLIVQPVLNAAMVGIRSEEICMNNNTFHVDGDRCRPPSN